MIHTTQQQFTIANRPTESYGSNIESDDQLYWSIIEVKGIASKKYVAHVNFNGTMCTRMSINGQDAPFDCKH